MERKYNILYLIVDNFIKGGVPVSSNALLEQYDLKISSATIRNEMSALEKDGFIEKAYKHSGRVPTQKAYKFYINNLKKDASLVFYAKEKINEIFVKREKDIDIVIDEVVNLINKTTNTISVIKNESKSLFIEDLNVYDIKNNLILIVCVLSNGKVIHQEQKINDLDFKNLQRAFKLMASRLKGTTLLDLKDKASSILELLKFEIKNVEFNFKTIVFNLFNKILNLSSTSDASFTSGFNLMSKVNNTSEIKKIFELIENNTIWDLIDNPEQDGEIFIDLSDNDVNELAVINKTINFNNGRKKIAFIGPKNQDYKKLITMIDLLEEKIKD